MFSLPLTVQYVKADDTKVLPEPVITAKALSFAELITRESEKHGVSANLALSIARCESSIKQYNGDGTVLRGRINPQDVGLFQINEKYHLEDSRKLGFNIYESEGNIGYAVYLLRTQGSQPWFWSASCWQG